VKEVIEKLIGVSMLTFLASAREGIEKLFRVLNMDDDPLEH